MERRILQENNQQEPEDLVDEEMGFFRSRLLNKSRRTEALDQS